MKFRNADCRNIESKSVFVELQERADSFEQVRSRFDVDVSHVQHESENVPLTIGDPLPLVATQSERGVRPIRLGIREF